ncbi:MAG TPA: hypothetical protein VK249_31145, partial [Anaerolineales bacterium]|nr:hypothetical protein [Anaerolineales bacterium]
MNYHSPRYLLLILCALIFSACAAPATPTPINMAFVDIPKPQKRQDTLTPHAIPTATSIATAEALKVSIWAPPYLVETLGGTLADPLKGLFIPEAATANVKLEVGEQNLISQWVYAAVTPFSSTIQGISGNDLLLAWQGQAMSDFGNQPLLMDQNTYDMFSVIWGPAASTGVQVMVKDALLDYAWAHQPALAIVPFESLDPRWKV